MRKLKENEIAAEYKTSWDSGYTTIYSPCIINTETKEIVNIYKRGREIYSKDEDINRSNVDNCIDCLDSEVVYMNGKEYPIVPKEELTDGAYWRKE